MEAFISAFSGNLFLILLFLVLVFSFGYTFAIIYHLARFGVGTGPKKAAAVYFAGAVLLLFILFGTFTSLDTSELVNGIQGQVKKSGVVIPQIY